MKAKQLIENIELDYNPPKFIYTSKYCVHQKVQLKTPNLEYNIKFELNSENKPHIFIIGIYEAKLTVSYLKSFFETYSEALEFGNRLIDNGYFEFKIFKYGKTNSVN